MYSRNGCYAKSPNVKVRTFEAWGRAYAFTPDDPEIYDLNTTAWFILELCDGRPYQQIEADYVRQIAPRVGDELARRHFSTGFNALLERNIISASN